MIHSIRQTSSRDDPYKSCVVSVQGPNHPAMINEAKREATRFLKEPFVNLVASDAGNAQVVAVERYVPHLGVKPRPVAWSMTVTVKLDPEIVKERRQRIRELQSGAHPEDPEKDVT
jgi:hypothetical protein